MSSGKNVSIAIVTFSRIYPLFSPFFSQQSTSSFILFRLYRMHESGLMNKWIAEQIPTKDKCSDGASNQVVDERKVNVSDMQGIFFVLFMGNVFEAE